MCNQTNQGDRREKKKKEKKKKISDGATYHTYR